MTELYFSVTPHDPIIARDARPFSFGIRMKSLDWLYPSVLAGSVRTMLGKVNGADFDQNTVARLKNVTVAGPLPLWKNTLFLPAPLDLVVGNDKDGNRIAYPLRPTKMRNGEWCNLPKENLRPVMMPQEVDDDFKPLSTAGFWSREMIIKWLASDPAPFNAPPPPEEADPAAGFMPLPEKDARVHVSIDPVSGLAKESMLFETVGLDLDGRGVQIAARVDPNDFEWRDSFHPLGGERRLGYWAKGDDPGWGSPPEIQKALEGASHLRMVLATPAVFKGGWLPGWLDWDTLSGAPPGAPAGITLTLRAASVDRWKPLSGWDLEKGRRGPKPIRRLVPAGSVYFFEVQGNPVELAEDLWLRPVSDTVGGQNYSTDGFGLALWGVWNNEDGKRGV